MKCFTFNMLRSMFEMPSTKELFVFLESYECYQLSVGPALLTETTLLKLLVIHSFSLLSLSFVISEQ